MTKEGSLRRIKKYEATGRDKMAEDEKIFYELQYGAMPTPKVVEEPVVEKKAKK